MKGSGIPSKFLLYQNYPNPFNPSTVIKFDIPSVSNSSSLYVQLKVYDILGRCVESLLESNTTPGSYKTTWDASNYSSGLYFYNLTIFEPEKHNLVYSSTNKMILLK